MLMDHVTSNVLKLDYCVNLIFESRAGLALEELRLKGTFEKAIVQFMKYRVSFMESSMFRIVYP